MYRLMILGIALNFCVESHFNNLLAEQRCVRHGERISDCPNYKKSEPKTVKESGNKKSSNSTVVKKISDQRCVRRGKRISNCPNYKKSKPKTVKESGNKKSSGLRCSRHKELCGNSKVKQGNDLIKLFQQIKIRLAEAEAAANPSDAGCDQGNKTAKLAQLKEMETSCIAD